MDGVGRRRKRTNVRKEWLWLDWREVKEKNDGDFWDDGLYVQSFFLSLKVLIRGTTKRSKQWACNLYATIGIDNHNPPTCRRLTRLSFSG